MRGKRRGTNTASLGQTDPLFKRSVLYPGGARSSTLVLGLTGAALLCVAFPPLGWSAVAWFAPVPWIVLICREKLSGRRPYVLLWLVGLIHWLFVIHWIRLPHWSAFFGWLALASYLALYLPLFVAISRLAVYRTRLSVVLAAPAVWTGLELLRGYLLTGFSMALLGHTQVEWTHLIQISDVSGAYAVGFLIMFVASCLTRAIPIGTSRAAFWPLLLAAAVAGSVLVYGHYRLTSGREVDADVSAQLALIQGSIDVTFERDQRAETTKHYQRLSCDALAANPELDAIVWPESMCAFRASMVTYASEAVPMDMRALLDQENFVFRQELKQLRALHDIARQVHSTSPPPDSSRLPLPAFVICCDTAHFEDENKYQRYNTALFVDPTGKVADRYDKMHPVMFGEYVPLGNFFPWLYKLTPMGSGLTPGRGPAVFDISGVRLSPSICFESTVPHLIRSQVNELRRRGTPPDALVNLTNDGWFWGSSELDLHLACGVFRAIENRLPLLIAANTGFSAWIDAQGRILKKGPRRADGVIIASIGPSDGNSIYQNWGDWFAWLCLGFSLVVVVLGGWLHLRDKRPVGAENEKPK